MTRADLARLALAALAEGRDADARRLTNQALAPDANDVRHKAPVLSFLLDLRTSTSPHTWE